jgi:Ca-activated chloride channel family protein
MVVATTLVCGSQDDVTTLKVDVKLVNVFVTVTDSRGGPVSGLQKENFVLKEDGKEQKISVFSRESALPLSIVLAIDTSLSTKKDLPLEQAAAHKFAHTIVRPEDGLAVYKFSEEVTQVVPFTSDLRRIDEGIDRLRNGSDTALFDVVFLGAEALGKRQGRKVIVAVTDGGDTISQVNYQQALRAAQESEAIIYSVIIVPIEASAGRDTGGEHALMQFSEDTGGKYYYATSLSVDEAFENQRRATHATIGLLSFATLLNLNIAASRLAAANRQQRVVPFRLAGRGCYDSGAL